MSKVEVLCPNGRRVLVKVDPNTKLLKVLHAILGIGMQYCPATELATLLVGCAAQLAERRSLASEHRA